jgi:hypothetical protein
MITSTVKSPGCNRKSIVVFGIDFETVDPFTHFADDRNDLESLKCDLIGKLKFTEQDFNSEIGNDDETFEFTTMTAWCSSNSLARQS